MNPLTRLSIALVLAGLALSAAAAPAPWYLWQSKVNGQLFCTDRYPGDGWTRFAGPYRDARCEAP